MLEQRGIFLKHTARLGIHDMFLERNEAVAAADHKNFIEQLEELKEILSAGIFARHREFGFMQDLLDHMRGRRNHEHAQGDAQDDHEFRGMQQYARMTSGQHEAAEGGREDDDRTDNNQHDRALAVLGARQISPEAQDGLRVNLGNARLR